MYERVAFDGSRVHLSLYDYSKRNVTDVNKCFKLMF